MTLKNFYERLARTPGLSPLKVARLEEAGLSVEEIARRYARPEGPKSLGDFLTPACTEYPEKLRHLKDPPLRLFYRGLTPSRLSSTVVGIVGSRKASSFGLNLARRLGQILSRKGATVCSGLAKGIDGAAHSGVIQQLARDPEGAPPLAVLGHGFGHLHPIEHLELADKVARQGSLVTEYPPHFAPTKWSFPARNRLIAALSDHLVVVEAGSRSGTLYTAEFADQLGRTLWIVPMAPGRPNSEGVHRLWKSGAEVIHDLEEFAEQVVPSARPGSRPDRRAPKLCATKREILRVLARSEGCTEPLCRSSELSPVELACHLTELELDGLVKRELDGGWQLLCWDLLGELP